MTVKRRQGDQEAIATTVDPTRSAWQTNVAQLSGPGTIVMLAAISGLTKESVLQAPFFFQCPPLESFPKTVTWSYTDFETIGGGTHSRPSVRQLATVTINSLMVDGDAAFVIDKRPRHPLLAARELEQIGDSMSPFYLVAGQPALWGNVYDISMAATLRSFEIEERAGEVDARYFTVSFTEFTDAPTLRSLLDEPVSRVPQSQAGKPQRPSPSSGKKYYDVFDPQYLPANRRTLRELAKRYYGSYTAWRPIARASGLHGVLHPDEDIYEELRKKHPHGALPAIKVPVLPPRAPTATNRTVAR